jgi:hypothetical protein
VTDPLSTVVVIAAVLGTFGLLERRMDRLERRFERRFDRLEDHVDTGFTEMKLEIREIRSDFARHLEWHIENQSPS